MSDKLKNNRSFEEMIKDLENSGKDETKSFDELIRDLYVGIGKKADMIKERVNFIGASKNIIENKNKEDELVADTHFFKFLEKLINNPTWAKSQGYPIDSQGYVKINIGKLSNILQEAKETLLSLDKGRETIYNAYFQKTKDTLEIENLKSEIKGLKSKTHKFDQYKKFYEEYNVSAGVISAENKNLLAEIERLKNSNAFISNHKDTLKVFEKFNFQLNEKQNKINALVDEVNSLIDYKELYEKQHPEYKKQLEINDILNKENEELTAEIERLKIQFYNSNSTYMDKFGNILTSNEIREIQENLDILTLDFKDLKEYRNQLKQENEKLKLENQELKTPIGGNNTSLSLMYQKVQQSTAVINKLELENEELRKKLYSASRLNNDVNSQEIIDQLEREKTLLKDTNIWLENEANEKSERVDTIIKDLKNEIESLKKQLEETKYSLEVFTEDRNKYLHLSFNLKDDIESLNKELDKKNIEISILRSLFGKPQWTPQDDFAPSPGPWTATYDTNTNTVSEFKEIFSQGCDEFCGMNYCDEYGCIENKAEIDSNDLIIIDQLKEKEYQLAPQLPKGYVLHSDGIISFTAGMMPKVTNIEHVNLADNIVPTASNTTKVGVCEHTYCADIPEYVKKAADNYPNCKVVKNNIKTEEVDKSISEKHVDCAISQPDGYTPTKEMTTPYLECKNELQGLGVKAEETKAEIPNIRKRRSQPYF